MGSELMMISQNDMSEKDGPCSSYDGSKTTNHSTISP